MVTIIDEHTYEFRGLSTDIKPLNGVGNGSIFLEMDTCEVYIFDESTKTWIKL